MRGRFKFRCAECKAENWLTAKERDRASLPQCCACGSRYLDAVTDDARDRIACGNDAGRAAAEDRDRKRGVQR